MMYLSYNPAKILGILFALGNILYGADALAGTPVKVNGDNSVTITFAAPEAESVEVQGNFFRKGGFLNSAEEDSYKDGKASMTRDESGMWTYTTSPLTSDLYWYNFAVGDSTACDPRNPNRVRDINTLYNYFILTGGIGNCFVDNVTEHGSLNYVWYPSTLNGKSKRRMAVYLPKGYEDTLHRYPVLYLLHGSGGDETAWADCGRLVQIMDNLIAAKQCKPMIVVMPNGNADLAAAPGMDPQDPQAKPSANNVSSMFGKIESAFVPEIVNYVDKHYRTLADQAHRAIAGLSLGGLHTLHISINNPDTFGYVGLFSAQTTNALDNSSINSLQQLGKNWSKLKKNLPFLGGKKLDRKITRLTGGKEGSLEVYANFDEKLKDFYAHSPRLMYIAVGTDDFTKKLNDNLRQKIAKEGYPFVYNESSGGHTWTNWRRYLTDYLPRLFN